MMEVGPPRSFLKELSIADPMPYLKFRLGGSRSSVVSNKFLRDVIYKTGTRHESILTHEHTRSVDSNSSGGSRSTDSSATVEKVRILGRGGAGARCRNYTKEHNDIRPAPIRDMEPLHVPKVQHDGQVLRNLGRGGLGSRPQTLRDKSKAGPATGRESSFELLDIRKRKKWRPPLPFDTEVRARSPAPSPGSSSSTVLFTEETPTPGCLRPTRRGLEDPGTSKVVDKRSEMKRTSSFHNLHNTRSATPWDDTHPKSRSKHGSRTKGKQPLSLFFSIFQNDATANCDSTPSPASISTLPSQITLTSIETDPSYFFHGPGSPPSTPPCYQQTDSAESYRSVTSLSSFPPESSSSTTTSGPKQEESDECDNDEIDDDLPTPRPRLDQDKYSGERELQPFLLASASEVDALGSFRTPDSSFLENESSPLELPPTTLETEGFISKAKRSESWIGEWNVGMVDAIRALRELR